MPTGLKILRVFCIFYIALSIVSFGIFYYLPQHVSWFPNILDTQLTFLWVFNLLLLSTVLIAIHSRNSLFFQLGTASLIGLLFLTLRDFEIASTDIFHIAADIHGVVFYLLFLWYWMKKKSYFIQSTNTTNDKIDNLIKWYIIFWIILGLAISVSSSLAGIKDRVLLKQNLFKFLTQLEGKSYRERLEYCGTNVSILEKDTCYFAAFSMTKNKTNITPEDCEKMTNETYRFSCYAMGGSCKSIQEDVLKKSCLEIEKIYNK